MALIKCKECGTEISSKAEICPKCGAAGRKKTSMLTWLVAGFFILVFIGWCGEQMVKRPTITTTTDNAIDQTRVESLTTISAYDLALAYHQNTVQADQRFKGKRFIITGIVVDINTDFLDRPYLVLDGGVNQFMNPHFAFNKGQENILANIKKGDRVVLVCRVKGDIAKTPMSESCSFSMERSEAQNSSTSQPMQEQETDEPTPVPEAAAPAPAAPAAPAPAAPAENVNNSGIETTIRNYYQSIQNKRFEEAINAFSVEKKPKLNIDLIVRIGKDTEFYKIDSINVSSNDGTHAQATVRLRHKKYNSYEENWEIYVSLVNENGVWKIVSTPGRKL